MDQKLRNYYLEAQVNNASAGQLLIMLYDGLIDQAERAEMEMVSPQDPNNSSTVANAVSRCINFLTELSASLRHEVDPALCGHLSRLYLFFTREFVEALDRREPKKIRAILPLLCELRGAWIEADRRAGRAKQLEALAAA